MPDTNVVISAYLNHDGPPFRVLKLALSGLIKLYCSDPILAEYKEVILRKSYPLDKRRAILFLEATRSASTFVKPAPGFSLILPDPDDAMFLQCAEAAKAHFLVIGNTKHFPPRWKLTRRTTPSAFLSTWYSTHSTSFQPKR